MIFATIFTLLNYLKGETKVKVELISHTFNPEQLVATAAKLCYSSSSISDLKDSIEKNDISSFIKMLMNMGHESPLEHVTFTFGIEDVSRALLAQLTRHRIGSYSVQSQRYVKNKFLSYVIPPEIESLPEAKKIFICAMEEAKKAYDKLTDILKEKYKSQADLFNESEGLNDIKLEKIAIEDARYVLPNAWSTTLICTFNARSLFNFFSRRCCNRAQWEIRNLAWKMLELTSKVAPCIFAHAGPCCVHKTCSEGKMSCKKSKEVRQHHKSVLDKAGEN